MADANPYAQFVVAPPASAGASGTPSTAPTNPYAQFVTAAPQAPQQADVPVIDVGGSARAPMGQPGSQYMPSVVGGGGQAVGPNATVSAQSAPAAAGPTPAPTAPAIPLTQAPQAPSGTAPGQTFIAPPQQGAPPQGPGLIAGNPQPTSAAPTRSALQGFEDAVFGTLDQIPGVNQIGAATDAALGYLVGDGSQADTFGQRYQENLAANLAHLQSIPAPLRVATGVVGAVPAALLGGAAVGMGADAAAEAVPALQPALNALSDLPSAIRYAGAGAAQGAAQGASDARTNADIAPNAIQDALIGAGLGAAGPAFGRVIGGTARAAGEYLSPIMGRSNALTDTAGVPLTGSDGQPIMATANQARMAGQHLTDAASNPAAARDALAGGPIEIIPGSPPTTAQQAGDRGLLSLERAKATQNPDAFAGVREQQNSARRAVITGMRGNGDPADVTRLVRSHLDALDKTTADLEAARDQAVTGAEQAGQQQVAAARAAADQAGAGLGGAQTPEELGVAMRGPVSAAREIAKAQERRLWAAVDPNGTLGMDVTPIRRAARSILAERTPSAAPLSAAEAHVLQTAAGYQPLTAFREVGDLRQALNAALGDELKSRGRTPTYARLSRFKEAVEGAIDGAVKRRAAREAEEVAQGIRSPEDTMEARLAAERDSWLANRNRSQAIPGDEGPVSAGSDAPGSMGGVPGMGRAPRPGAWGPGNGGRDTGLAPQPAVVDNFDSAAADRLRFASAATRERARLFDSGPVGQITRTGRSADEFKLSDAAVPGAILKPGPRGREALDAYAAAGGDMGAARDALAMQARLKAIRPDGTLNPDALARFRVTYGRALSHPDMQPLTQALQTTEGAERAVGDAAANAREAVRAADQQAAARVLQARDAARGLRASVAGRFEGANAPSDVVRQIGGLFGTRNSASQFADLAQLTENEPAARDGVRRAIVAHIESKLIGNTEVGASDQVGIKADQFQTFMRQNEPALRHFFTENEVRTMGLLGLDMRRAARSMNAVKLPGGSNTAQDTAGVAKFTLAARLGRSLIGQIAEPGILGILGGEGGGLAGAVAGVGAAAVRQTLVALRNAGLRRVDDLVIEAMIHPEIARILMSKVTPETEPRVLRALAHSVTRAAAVDLGVQAQN